MPYLKRLGGGLGPSGTPFSSLFLVLLLNFLWQKKHKYHRASRDSKDSEMGGTILGFFWDLSLVGLFHEGCGKFPVINTFSNTWFLYVELLVLQSSAVLQ
jgi:hypothetical protein